METGQKSLLNTYLVAMLAVAGSTLVRLLAWPKFGAEVPFLFFYPSLALAAWYGGFGPGMLATALSTLVASYLFVPPIGVSGAFEGSHILYLSIFVITGIAISVLMQRLHAALERSEEAVHEIESSAAEAREGKRILDAMLAYIPEGIAITEISEETIRRVSDHWCEITGFRREALEGASLSNLFDRRSQQRDKKEGDPGPMASTPLIQAVRGGQVVTAQEWSLKRADGGSVPILCSAGPIRDSGGNIIQGVIAWTDITRRKRTEEELRRAYATLELRVQERTEDLATANKRLAGERNKLAHILGAMPDAVCIVNRDNVVEYANAAMESQFGPPTGKKCYDYLYCRTDPCPWCRNEEVFGGLSLETECTSPRTKRCYDTFDTLLPNSDGTVSKLKILRDITERKRRESERARQQQQIASLWNVSRQSHLPLPDFYDLILTEVLRITESRYGFVGFVNADESVVTVHAWSREAMADCRIPTDIKEFPVAGAGIWAEAIRTRRPLIVNDYDEAHPGKLGLPDGHVVVRRLLAVPVLTNGHVAVVAAVANREQEYTPADAEQTLAFLTSVQAVADKKKAEEALIESRAELQRLSAEILRLQEVERSQTSRTLHEEIAQALAFVKLRVGLLEMNLGGEKAPLREHCQVVQSQIDTLIDRMRRISSDLSPAALDALGVTAALRRLIHEVAEAGKLDISTDLDDIDHLLPSDSRIAVYRVIQETLANIVRHSGATSVAISAKEGADRICFEVHDNGGGFSVEELETSARSGGGGLGFPIMRERLRALGADLEILSHKGGGTRLTFSIPIAIQ